MKRLVRELIAPNHHLARLSKKEELAEFLQLAKVKGCRHPLRRVGPARDGGYLLPDDLEGIVACISPGVDVETGFDLEIAELGIPVFMADASVEGPAIEHANFHFQPMFIDVTETE